MREAHELKGKEMYAVQLLQELNGEGDRWWRYPLKEKLLFTQGDFSDMDLEQMAAMAKDEKERTAEIIAEQKNRDTMKNHERIGNEIILKSLRVKGFLSYNYATTGATSNYQNAKLAVRVMIVKAKDYNEANLAFDNMPTDTLLRFGNWDATGNAGPSNFGGFVLDPFRDINRDTFSVRFDETYQIEAPVLIGGTTSTTAGVIPATTKVFRHKLKFGAITLTANLLLGTLISLVTSSA